MKGWTISKKRILSDEFLKAYFEICIDELDWAKSIYGFTPEEYCLIYAEKYPEFYFAIYEAKRKTKINIIDMPENKFYKRIVIELHKI